MFNHFLFSTIAAGSLAMATPVLAGVGPPFPASGEDGDSQRRVDTAEQKPSEQISADAVSEGKEVPAAYEAPDEQQGAPRAEDAQPSFYGPTGSELNTFGGG